MRELNWFFNFNGLFVSFNFLKSNCLIYFEFRILFLLIKCNYYYYYVIQNSFSSYFKENKSEKTFNEIQEEKILLQSKGEDNHWLGSFCVIDQV